MKNKIITQVNSEYYGTIFYREIGEIDFLKDHLAWSEKYHPRTWFNGYMMKPKSDKKWLNIEEQRNLTEQEFRDYHKSTYNVIMEDDNRDWFNTNKDFLNALPSDDVRRVYLKIKELPVAHTEEHYLNWYINSKHMLSEDWLLKNKEYVAELDSKVKAMEEEFIQAVESEDIKGIRKATKRGINLKLNNEFALHKAVEKDNKEMVTYFLNKGFKPTDELIASSKSDDVKECLKTILEKNQKKEAKEVKRARPRM